MNLSFYITAVCFTALTLQCIHASPMYLQLHMVTGVMGSKLQLPGHLIVSNGIMKNGIRVNVTDDIYELRHTAHGTHVIIRMLTCTDEGTYIIGDNTFRLTVIPGRCNVFYFTAKATRRDAALIGPLSQVSRISKLQVGSPADRWSMVEVWNDTMSTRKSPGFCCFMVNNGTTFGGYAESQHTYYVYEIHGSASDSCSTVKKTISNNDVSCSDHDLELFNLGTIKTVVNLEDISDGTLCHSAF